MTVRNIVLRLLFVWLAIAFIQHHAYCKDDDALLDVLGEPEKNASKVEATTSAKPTAIESISDNNTTEVGYDCFYFPTKPVLKFPETAQCHVAMLYILFIIIEIRLSLKLRAPQLTKLLHL